MSTHSTNGTNIPLLSPTTLSSLLNRILKLYYTFLTLLTEYRSIDQTGIKILLNLHNLGLRLELLSKTLISPGISTSLSLSSPSSLLSVYSEQGTNNQITSPTTTINFSQSTISYQYYRLLGPLSYHTSGNVILYTKSYQEFLKQQTNLLTIYTSLVTIQETILDHVQNIEQIYMIATNNNNNNNNNNSVSTDNLLYQTTPEIPYSIQDILYFISIIHIYINYDIYYKFQCYQSIKEIQIFTSEEIINNNTNKNKHSSNNTNSMFSSIIKKLESNNKLWSLSFDSLNQSPSLSSLSYPSVSNPTFTIKENITNNTIISQLQYLLWKITSGTKTIEEILLFDD